MTKKLTLPLLLVLLLCAMPLLAQQAFPPTEAMQTTVIDKGVGLGAVIAVVASWSRNQSILWAILHGILSWLYVLYFALTRSADE